MARKYGLDQCIFFLVIVANPVFCLFHVYPRHEIKYAEKDVGEPLFLTPLIEAGKIEEAQNLSLVVNLGGYGSEVVSYSGYFTTNKQYNSNLFFWFFPAQNNNASAPVLLWLQGGPGSSSLFGLFTEHGPFYVDSNYELQKREYAWTREYSVLYIDNPAGTGFSFTESDDGFAKNQSDVGEGLYEALQQFFQLFPDLQQNDFFVTGESYAGKYVPAISYKIHQENPQAKLKINLKGIAIGNGLSDPEHMFLYGDYLYQIGLIDSNGRDKFHALEQMAVQFIQEQKWVEAFEIFDILINGDLTSQKSLFFNLTGFDVYFNFLHDKDDAEYYTTFVQSDNARKALHVGNLTYHLDKSVEIHLMQDVPKSVRNWVEELLEHYRIIIYNGQLDIIVAYPLTENFLRNLNWSAAQEYASAPRYQWLVDGLIAGYSRSAGNLLEVLVRNAGHLVPMDQPKTAYDLITRFVENKPFHE